MEDIEKSFKDKKDAEIFLKAQQCGEFEDREIVKKRLLVERGAAYSIPKSIKSLSRSSKL